MDRECLADVSASDVITKEIEEYLLKNNARK
jgi:hypothetical protein